jgi:hypothetical protein
MGFVTRLTRRVPLVEQELLTLPEHLSSPPGFQWGSCYSIFSFIYICFIDRCLSFCTFSFGHCVVCSSSIYGFWLFLWYLQTLLIVPSFESITLLLGKEYKWMSHVRRISSSIMNRTTKQWWSTISPVTIKRTIRHTHTHTHTHTWPCVLLWVVACLLW